MKYILICFLALCAACQLKRSISRDIDIVSQKAPEVFPPENAAELRDTYHRGFGLYKVACTGSGCHGASDKGNDTIPHFTRLELDNYETDAKNNNPENHAVAAKLSPEQLNDILTFLIMRTIARQPD